MRGPTLLLLPRGLLLLHPGVFRHGHPGVAVGVLGVVGDGLCAGGRGHAADASAGRLRLGRGGAQALRRAAGD
ncbi:hypothetical protein CEXT_487211 [Caerostris extrusa]|uniref:Secreted protein n=1 Tax=Caerostris extrusa TaxID=172846 RepID=A0AAV4MFQ1_CAEEX|nr:hypothetical protein CEXT_487211 [Caerostris extrusa]